LGKSPWGEPIDKPVSQEMKKVKAQIQKFLVLLETHTIGKPNTLICQAVCSESIANIALKTVENSMK
jgi:hypothetical protein